MTWRIVRWAISLLYGLTSTPVALILSKAAKSGRHFRQWSQLGDANKFEVVGVPILLDGHRDF